MLPSICSRKRNIYKVSAWVAKKLTFSSLIAQMELSSFVASVTMRRFAARLPLMSAAGPPPPDAATEEDGRLKFTVRLGQRGKSIRERKQ